jgi:hypothetical protein
METTLLGAPKEELLRLCREVDFATGSEYFNKKKGALAFKN